MSGFRLKMLLAGVGGQGVMLVTRTISEAAMNAGYRVLVAETHGQAVRGGSITSHLTFGADGVDSPLIMKGAADIVIGFEPIETVRVLPFLKNQHGVIVYNVEPILAITMRYGAEKYPPLEEISGSISKCSSRVFAIDAVRLAKAAGSARTVNTVLLGASYEAIEMGMPQETLLEVLRRNVPPGTENINLKAFAAGREDVSSRQSSNL